MFPSCLKFVDVIPLFQKGRKDAKQNYRLVSIFPTLSKIYKRNMFKQMSSFWQYIAQAQVGLRKGFSTQQCLLTLLEKMQLIKERFLVLFWLIFLSHLTVSTMNFWLWSMRFYFTCFEYTHFFYKQHFYRQHQAKTDKKLSKS